MVNEFGDAELPNINSIANLSSGFTNIAGQTYNGGDPSNVNTNMNLTMNWPAASEVPSLTSLPWPSGLLNPSLSVNSLLLKALQLRNYQQREAAAAAADHFATYNIPQGFSQLGTDLSSNLSVSASRVLECMSQQQEQPFNMAPFGG